MREREVEGRELRKIKAERGVRGVEGAERGVEGAERGVVGAERGVERDWREGGVVRERRERRLGGGEGLRRGGERFLEEEDVVTF